jgi:hypothetical protein
MLAELVGIQCYATSCRYFLAPMSESGSSDSDTRAERLTC